jgi:hypothetical protein
MTPKATSSGNGVGHSSIPVSGVNRAADDDFPIILHLAHGSSRFALEAAAQQQPQLCSCALQCAIHINRWYPQLLKQAVRSAMWETDRPLRQTVLEKRFRRSLRAYLAASVAVNRTA